jgi:NADH-quinone oxidoreductase subunit J
MSPANLWFSFCALLGLSGALSVLFARNPIRAALGLLATILGIAGLFLKLGAELLAAVQLLIYAGAVVVLFVFVILLVGPVPTESPHESRSRLARVLGGAMALGGAALGLVMLGAQGGESLRLGPLPPGHGSVETLGNALFARALVPFELSTALLVVAVVGAMAIVRTRRLPKPEPPEPDATRRLFGGPVHPRDIGHPPPEDGRP